MRDPLVRRKKRRERASELEFKHDDFVLCFEYRLSPFSLFLFIVPPFSLLFFPFSPESLPPLIAQHMVEKLSLPCKLVLPNSQSPATMKGELVNGGGMCVSGMRVSAHVSVHVHYGLGGSIVSEQSCCFAFYSITPHFMLGG